MGETKKFQKGVKIDVDNKLLLAAPTREILEDLAVACAKDPSPDNTFQYAFCLSKSTERSELRYAVTILDGLVKEGYEHQLDCAYGSAVALYLLREYDRCRFRCEAILRTNPDNRVASELHLACMAAAEEADAQKFKDVALGSTAVAVGVGIIAGVASLMLAKR